VGYFEHKHICYFVFAVSVVLKERALAVTRICRLANMSTGEIFFARQNGYPFAL
jgi:hypothetical protein